MRSLAEPVVEVNAHMEENGRQADKSNIEEQKTPRYTRR
jgi:hypothetical protein